MGPIRATHTTSVRKSNPVARKSDALDRKAKYLGYDAYVSPKPAFVLTTLQSKDASEPVVYFPRAQCSEDAFRFLEPYLEAMSNCVLTIKAKCRSKRSDSKAAYHCPKFKLTNSTTQSNMVPLSDIPGAPWHETPNKDPTITFDAAEFLVLQEAAKRYRLRTRTSNKTDSKWAEKVKEFSRLEHELHERLRLFEHGGNLPSTPHEWALLEYGRVARKALAVCRFIGASETSNSNIMKVTGGSEKEDMLVRACEEHLRTLKVKPPKTPKVVQQMQLPLTPSTSASPSPELPLAPIPSTGNAQAAAPETPATVDPFLEYLEREQQFWLWMQQLDLAQQYQVMHMLDPD